MARNEVELGIQHSPPHASDLVLDIELENFYQNHEGGGENEFSLPPVDGGKDAWLFLAAAFMIELLVWGMDLDSSASSKAWATSSPQSTYPHMHAN